jgi:hypothetical protein
MELPRTSSLGRQRSIRLQDLRVKKDGGEQSMLVPNFRNHAQQQVLTRVEYPPAILSDWKTIASYLGKGVRTVQRWERDLALPVRRNRIDTKGILIAFVAEIDDWVRERQFRGRTVVFSESERNRLVLQSLEELRAENQALRSQLCERATSSAATFDGSEQTKAGSIRVEVLVSK